MVKAARMRGAVGGAPSLPPGVRVYAVGDIHGHPELLDRMMALVERDLMENPHPAPVEVFLGDFVDRGPDSRGVVDRLLRPPAEGRTRVCLSGNHEEAFLEFLEDASTLGRWASFGGLETLASYGVPLRFLHGGADAAGCRRALLELVPEAHVTFLKELAISHRIGDVLFVHAGIRPGVPLEQQSPRDLLWIREPFLSHRKPLPVRVVHGHTPHERPTVHPWRINVDTGAFATGRLTAAVLEDADVRFLSTRPLPD